MIPKSSDVVGVELHGFSDASELAYSTIVYLRSTSIDGAVHTSIVIAKTKVSPYQVHHDTSVELCGALIVA